MNLIGTLRSGSGGNLLQTMGNFMQNSSHETTGGVVSQPPASGGSDAENRIGNRETAALLEEFKKRAVV
jgi:hypothetical protein